MHPRLPDLPFRLPSFRKPDPGGSETPAEPAPGQGPLRAASDPGPARTRGFSGLAVRAATHPRGRNGAAPEGEKPRPVISSPMNPRPWGMPIISRPLNPRPYGLPDPVEGRTSAPRPVGPNYWLKMRGQDPEIPQGISPNYPAAYTYLLGDEGRFGGPSIKSGPSLLSPVYKVEGPVDYGKTPDAQRSADLGMYSSPEFGSQVSSGIAKGFPPTRDGKPTLPFNTPFAEAPKVRPSEVNPWGLPGPEIGFHAAFSDTPRARAEEEPPPRPEPPRAAPPSPPPDPARRRSSDYGLLADSGYASLPGDKPLE